jgi:mxaK protein
MKRRRIFLWASAAVLASGVAVAVQATISMVQTDRAAAAVAALGSGIDRAVPPDAPGAVLAARGIFLLARGHPEDAQAIADRMAGQEDQGARATLLYDLGNFMLRRGLGMYFTRPMRETAPVIRIAQAEYREALHEDPQNWDARYNLDIADALVRDAQSATPTVGSQMAPDKALVPDEPGAPGGLP